MKKLLMISIVVASTMLLQAQTTSSASASEKSKMERKANRPDANTRATRMTEKMTKQLMLTEEQKPKVFGINLDKAKKIDALHEQVKAGGNKKDMAAKRKAIEQERDAELKGVLTPEQYEKWTKWKAEKKEEWKKKHKKMNKDKDEDGSSEVMDRMED